jgi:hypothetical protein
VKGAFLDRGDVREHILQQDVYDITGHYERNRPVVGSIGGHFMILSLSLQALQSYID